MKDRIHKVNGVDISQDGVAADVREYRDFLKTFDRDELRESPEEEPAGAIRLQVVDGCTDVHTGDACYDTDHRGLWAAAEVSPDADDDECYSIACDLIDGVLDAASEVS